MLKNIIFINTLVHVRANEQQCVIQKFFYQKFVCDVKGWECLHIQQYCTEIMLNDDYETNIPLCISLKFWFAVHHFSRSLLQADWMILDNSEKVTLHIRKI